MLKDNYDLILKYFYNKYGRYNHGDLSLRNLKIYGIIISDLSEAVPNNRKRSHEDESKSIIDGICVSEQKDLDVNKSHDKNEFDNVDIIDLIDDEEGITELSLIQEKVQKAIENSTDELQIKLLKLQQHMLKKLESGTHCPTNQNIHKLFAASSVFYFQQKTDDTYINFLTPYETAEIKSFVNSHFEHIGISDGIKLFVEENKKLNEAIYIVDYLEPIFNKTIHYFNYVTTHSWIGAESKASNLHKSPADVNANHNITTKPTLVQEIISKISQSNNNRKNNVSNVSGSFSPINIYDSIELGKVLSPINLAIKQFMKNKIYPTEDELMDASRDALKAHNSERLKNEKWMPLWLEKISSHAHGQARKLRGQYSSLIKDSLFKVFKECGITPVNTNTSIKDVDTWKKSDIVRWCYQIIDSKKTEYDVTDDETYFETILRKVWKKQEITSEKVAVCICVLDEHRDGVKADDKFIRKKMDEILCPDENDFDIEQY
ncbi:2334_t:CDS:2 [Entrophospora sp. SA101]|nr:2334_t:CDS:2 [Entrophospora sp. SA101]